MNENISLSDIAALMKNGDGNWETVLIILFLLICVGGGAWGNRAPAPQQNAGTDTLTASVIANGGPLTVGQFSDQSRLQEIQTGQRDITGAVKDSEMRLTANQSQGLQELAAMRQEMQACCAETQAVSRESAQKVLDKLGDMESQRLRDDLAAEKAKNARLEQQMETNQRLNSIENRMSIMPTVPTTPTFNAGAYPFCNCNCQAA